MNHCPPHFAQLSKRLGAHLTRAGPLGRRSCPLVFSPQKISRASCIAILEILSCCLWQSELRPLGLPVHSPSFDLSTF